MRGLGVERITVRLKLKKYHVISPESFRDVVGLSHCIRQRHTFRQRHPERSEGSPHGECFEKRDVSLSLKMKFFAYFVSLRPLREMLNHPYKRISHFIFVILDVFPHQQLNL